MTYEAKFKKIIEKNTSNGWLPKVQYLMNPELYFYAIIFNHKFLKAYFKNSVGKCDCSEYPSHDDNCPVMQDWKYHAKILVLEETKEEKINYLYKLN